MGLLTCFKWTGLEHVLLWQRWQTKPWIPNGHARRRGRPGCRQRLLPAASRYLTNPSPGTQNLLCESLLSQHKESYRRRTPLWADSLRRHSRCCTWLNVHQQWRQNEANAPRVRPEGRPRWLPLYRRTYAQRRVGSARFEQVLFFVILIRLEFLMRTRIKVQLWSMRMTVTVCQRV